MPEIYKSPAKWKILSDDKLRGLLDQARSSEGSTLVRCQSYNDAVSLRSRLLNFIKAEKDFNSEVYPYGHEMHARSIFEDLRLKQANENIIISKGEQIEVTTI